jgi:hypothetical protein
MMVRPDPEPAAPAVRCEKDHPGPAGSWKGFSLFPVSPHGNVAISIVTLLGPIGQPK